MKIVTCTDGIRFARGQRGNAIRAGPPAEVAAPPFKRSP
jgi:hypothetical protein